MPANLNRLIFLLSLLGLAVASFLLYEYNQPRPIVCPIGNGCETVRNSQYSQFLGISIPNLGIIYYLSISILSILYTQFGNKNLLSSMLLVTIPAVIFGIYLTFLEAYVIKAYCFWCVLSFIISVGILVALLKARTQNHLDEDRN